MHLEQVAARPHIGLVSEMTYNVSSETLNTTIPFHTSQWPNACVAVMDNKPSLLASGAALP